jgi:hypothetical protein
VLRDGQGAVQQAASAALRVFAGALSAFDCPHVCVVTSPDHARRYATRGGLVGTIGFSAGSVQLRAFRAFPSGRQLTGCSTTPATGQGADGRRFEKHRNFVAAPNISPVLG